VKGLPAEKFTIAGYGEYKPISPNDTEENRSLNRRIEIYIVK
jgi:chemotaxis protein MotB